MQTEIPTNGQTPDIWRRFHVAVEELGEFAEQVEKTLAPTAKQQYLATLEIGETLHLLASANDWVVAKMRNRNHFNAALLAAKGRMEEAKALVLVSGVIDGKNAEIREAQLLLALKEDPVYQQAKAEAETIEERIVENDADLDSHRSQQAALKIKLRLAAAQLEYLAGER